MFGRFIPKEEKFFDILTQAARNAYQAVSAFQELIHHWSDKSDKFQKIRDIESEGDLLTHEVIDKLNRTFVTPIDREDIHELAGEIDDVCDILQALSDRMQLYDLGKEMPQFMVNMVDLLEKSGKDMNAAVEAIPYFKRNSRVRDLCIEIRRVENEADDLLKNALADLFRDKKDALYVIKWKEIYEAVEYAHDKLAGIANTLEGILVKNA
ncbi:MAG: DUF47 family protein [Elusimicrobia bacterium]|nr:DUF47 family protein [Candidatus Obscuribacterium magneticum]